jgi:tetratricopeptide (TPR) repeat protein
MRKVVRLALPVALVVAVLLAFMPALDAGLVDWDDDDLLFFNEQHRSFDVDSLKWMFTTSFAGHYHPLTWLTYALDWALWKLEWFGYHLTSVLLHAAAAVVFYWLSRRLLACAEGNAGASGSAPIVWSAAWAASLFALHPLRVESATWLAARSNVLSGLLYIVAVGCYIRYAMDIDRANPQQGASPRLFYVVSVASCLLSLLAKATAVTLPFVLLILDAYPLRRWPRRERRTLLVIDKLPFLGLSVLFAYRAMVARQEGGALYSLVEHDMPARLAQACYGLAFYIWKTLWPSSLGPLYQIPSREVLYGPMLWLSAAAVTTIGIAAFRYRHRLPALPTALAVYVVTLLPVLGLVQSGPQLVADRYSYVPCLALALLGGGLLLRLLRAPAIEGHPNRRAGLGMVCFLVVAGLSCMTFLQADYWLSARHLWARGVAVSPDSPIANTNFADVLSQMEFYEDAARFYERAIELDPRDAVALDHYARVLERMQRPDAAIAHYLRALRIDPNRVQACFSLGRLLAMRGRAREALVVLRDGARRHPDALGIIDLLAQILSSHPDETVRNGEEAVRWAQRLVSTDKRAHPAALMTLATAYAEAGRYDEAIATAEQGLAVARSESDAQTASQLERRLELFRQQKAYRFEE